MVQTIFETNSRKEIIKRFLENYSHGYNELFSSVSGEYSNGIDALQKAINDLQVNDKLIETASGYFAIATKENKGKNRLLAYLGQIVCLYIMNNLFAIESSKQVIRTLEPQVPINIPTKFNMKGVGQNMAKGAGAALGGLISFIPPFKIAGVALTQAAMRLHAEEAILEEKPLDAEFYRLQDEILCVEYEKLHRILR